MITVSPVFFPGSAGARWLTCSRASGLLQPDRRLLDQRLHETRLAFDALQTAATGQKVDQQQLGEQLVARAKEQGVGSNSGYFRNGAWSKTVLTEIGPVEIDAARPPCPDGNPDEAEQDA